MEDDELLAALGARARARDEAPPTAEELARGLGVDADEAAALARGPSGEVRARIVEDAVAALGTGEDAGGQVVRGPASWWRRAVGAGVVAAAAAVALVVAMPRGGAPLPGYELEVVTEARAVRADGDDRALTLRAGDPWVVVLRPREAVEGAVAASAALVGAGRRVAVEAAAEVSPTGSVRLSGTAPADAAWADALVVRVGRPGTLGEGAVGGEAVVEVRRPVRWLEGP